jgi:hypothetical protein
VSVLIFEIAEKEKLKYRYEKGWVHWWEREEVHGGGEQIWCYDTHYIYLCFSPCIDKWVQVTKKEKETR